MADHKDSQDDLRGIPGSRTAGRPLLPIATKQIARGLLRLYARLKGELAKSSGLEMTMVPPAEAAAYMAHIEALMPLLGVDFDPEALRPVRSRVQLAHLGWGDLRSGTLAVLKADGGWMTYREIMGAVLHRGRLTLDDSLKPAYLQKVREALFFQTKSGAVERELNIARGQHEQIQRFRLSTTLFRK